jgi:hypothetical protein
MYEVHFGNIYFSSRIILIFPRVKNKDETTKLAAHENREHTLVTKGQA